MRIHLLTIVAIFLSMTACSFNPLSSQQAMNSGISTSDALVNTPGVDTNKTIGGDIGQAMDKNDQLKMSKALDSSLGKSTDWINVASGTTYIVTPIAKVEVNGNRFCRRYTTTATRGGSTQQFMGTACITADGNWHPVNG